MRFDPQVGTVPHGVARVGQDLQVLHDPAAIHPELLGQLRDLRPRDLGQAHDQISQAGEPGVAALPLRAAADRAGAYPALRPGPADQLASVLRRVHQMSGPGSHRLQASCSQLRGLHGDGAVGFGQAASQLQHVEDPHRNPVLRCDRGLRIRPQRQALLDPVPHQRSEGGRCAQHGTRPGDLGDAVQHGRQVQVRRDGPPLGGGPPQLGHAREPEQPGRPPLRIPAVDVPVPEALAQAPRAHPSLPPGQFQGAAVGEAQVLAQRQGIQHLVQPRGGAQPHLEAIQARRGHRVFIGDVGHRPGLRGPGELGLGLSVRSGLGGQHPQAAQGLVALAHQLRFLPQSGGQAQEEPLACAETQPGQPQPVLIQDVGRAIGSVHSAQGETDGAQGRLVPLEAALEGLLARGLPVVLDGLADPGSVRGKLPGDQEGVQGQQTLGDPGRHGAAHRRRLWRAADLCPTTAVPLSGRRPDRRRRSAPRSVRSPRRPRARRRPAAPGSPGGGVRPPASRAGPGPTLR
ncbi:Uncharacterised protein [Mycobacteroides abscessus subsp. abscessus]|nr:Uncharacterised protein [Mycobacteroides abscessus subsp. abscessus]